MSDTSTPSLSGDEILAIDRHSIWHPYASLVNAPPVYPVASASGVRITLSDGRALIDGMSSWWSTIHGYNHPVLNEAAKSQIDSMSHVMFGGLTHQPAAELAQLLVEISPPTLTKVFFSDSGSVSVEVALKMALQFWHSQGQPKKHQFLALHNGYHGDTFGAMAVCDPVNGMHHLFAKAMPKQHFAPAPDCGFDDDCSDADIAAFTTLIETHHTTLAAVILEPVVQGAGGMRFYSPAYLRRVRALCDQYQVLLIADEIATGFGRTGKLFACEHADIEPDILCLGKALTGGYMSMAATLCSDKISDGICSGEAGVFMHGPTFMANPLAAATALASTRLLLSSNWQGRVKRIEELLSDGLAPCRDHSHIADVRVLGAIGVIEAQSAVKMTEIQEAFMAQGVWVRPFGKLVYVMPQYIISDQDLRHLTSAMCSVTSNRDLFE